MKKMRMSARKKFWPILFLGLFLNVQAKAAGFGLNDVTQLFPLPEPNQIPAMIAADSGGAAGALIPLEIYQRFPALDNHFDALTLYHQNFKLIGARIDPCFREGASPTCRKQIRLIWQPLIEISGHTSTLDAAMHSFYEFNDSEWTNILKDWTQISVGNLTETLQINPSLRTEGYSGEHWSLLKKLILLNCGSKSLVRVTGMRVTAARMWSFVGYDQVNGSWQKMGIPRTQSTVQSFILFSDGMQNLNEFQGTLSPPPQNQLPFVSLVTNSVVYKAKTDVNQIKALMDQTLQIENPKLNNPGTIDCVSCHLAQTVRLWGESNFSDWDWKNEFQANRYSSAYDLQNQSVNPLNVNRVRAFGYFGTEPIFSQRVINESAEVATQLSKNRVSRLSFER